MNSEDMRQILQEAKTIAVVGLSDNPERESYEVAEYLQQQGYRIFPVNPTIERVLGQPSYASLRDIPEHIDIVDIFRRPEHVPAIVDDAIAIGADVVWMQLGIVNEPAAEKARQAGIEVVMNRCARVEHERLIG